MNKKARIGLAAAVIAALMGLVGLGLAYLVIAPSLPDIAILKDVRLQVPLRVYTRDGELIAEFGEMKRAPLAYANIPPQLVNAFLSAEDDRFFEHPGVDYQGILRAAANLVLTGEKAQGGSTITMQVARNFFLSNEKTYLRKLSEIFLALRIERNLSKEDILELYLNKIYLGHRSYGVGAAAQVYYGTTLDHLTLAQIAMIAGLPKAPSTYNPVTNPKRAQIRRNYVLGRMLALGYITREEHDLAIQAPVTASIHTLVAEVEAPYVAEMVRAEMVERYGNDAYTAGFHVFTTIDGRLQRAANHALRSNLLDYDQRHGYRGPEAHVEITEEMFEEQWRELIAPYRSVGGMPPALVVALVDHGATVYTQEFGAIELDWKGLRWARPYIDENNVGAAPKAAADVLSVGDVIRLQRLDDGSWQLSQIPELAGAMVSAHPGNGAILALIGGFDYFHSKFNRVSQGERQPGSNFKPFIYSAALEKGFTPASIINDAPVVFDDPGLEAEWRPENYSGRFYGPTRLREALIRSRNLVSIRLLRATGIPFALSHLENFGFDTSRLPRDLSLSLGSAVVTPLQLVQGYAVIANGGYKVKTFLIDRIDGLDGKTVFQAAPLTVCNRQCLEAREQAARFAATDAALRQQIEAGAANLPVNSGDEAATPPVQAVVEAKAPPDAPEEHANEAPPVLPDAPRVVEERNIYLITTMMQDVIRHGTGRRALVLERDDLAGKTGTTNDQRDAWFSGFNPDVVTTAWVGFDTPRPLGNKETGSRAALPMWIEYMAVALEGIPNRPLQQPAGLVTVRIDPETGELAGPDTEGAIFETFREENVPKAKNGDSAINGGSGPSSAGDAANITEELF